MTVDPSFREDNNLRQRSLWVLNTIFHQAVAVITIFVFWTIFKNMEHNNALLWHIFFSTAAYVPLMAEGVILFSGDNVWTLNTSRQGGKYWLHGILLGISTIAVTVGIAVEIHAKSDRGSDHFVSNHAITGLVSWLLVMLSLFLGLFSWHSQRLKNIARPVIFKFVHNFLGIAAYAIGISSLVLGFYLGAFTNLVTQTEKETTVGVVIIISVWSVLSAFKSGYNQLSNLFV